MSKTIEEIISAIDEECHLLADNHALVDEAWKIRGFVDGLFARGLDPALIVEQVQADEALTEPLRRAALNLVLNRSVEQSQQAP